MIDATNPARTSRRRFERWTTPHEQWPSIPALRSEIQRLNRLPAQSPCKPLANDAEWGHMVAVTKAIRHDQLAALRTPPTQETNT